MIQNQNLQDALEKSPPKKKLTDLVSGLLEDEFLAIKAMGSSVKDEIRKSW